jgi:hypothetical protein
LPYVEIIEITSSKREYSRMFGGYDVIKALAKARRVRVADLLVLAEKNDPFYAGSPAQRAKAEWFAELWARFGYTTGVHLRRVHYRLVSGEEVYHKHDGTPSRWRCGDFVQCYPPLQKRTQSPSMKTRGCLMDSAITCVN